MRALLVAAAAAALALSACSSGGTGSDGKVTITFWDNNGGPGRTPIYEELIKRFEAANPNIHVEYVGIPSSSVQQKYDTAIAGGSTPDVGGVTTSYLSNLVGQEALEPLDDRINASSALKGKLLAGLVETVRQTSPDGKLYSVPSSGNMDVIWYRADWFTEAGLEPPKTWDDLVTAATRLTDPGANRYGYTIRGGAGSVFQLLTEAYSYSGVGEFFTGGKSTVDDPRNAELVQKVAGLYKKATPEADVNNNYTQMVAQFTGGSVAMMHHNLGSYGDVSKALGDKVAAIPLPVGPGGKRTVVPNPTDGFAVFRNSRNPDAAWKFVEFLTSAESNSYWNEKVGQIPANTDVRSAAWIDSNKPVKMALGVLEDPATATVPAPVYLPQYSSITKTDSEPQYQKVLLGQLPAGQFLSDVADRLTAAQKEWEDRK